jgi:valyl-tRNA synthetase
VRAKIVEDIQALGQIAKIEEHINKVGFSERTDVVIEPRLSLQWFVDMKEISKPALDNVMNDNIHFFPPKFKNSYRNWMENIKDWCISRQLWWGHRIPAWYDQQGNVIVAKTEEQALQLFKEKNPSIEAKDIYQDPDVLDTWFSSWLWPISVFDGFYSEDEVKYYYPTADLVTAPEIMFFWVARMIIAGYEYRGELPFKNVYYTGIVRDKQGRKMSKSLGNSPDPLDLIDKFGADGVRVGMLLSSPAGNDLLFDESLCEQGRNFSNKIWNAFRLVKTWEEKIDDSLTQSEASKVAVNWMKNKFQKTLAELNDDYEKFRINEALMTTYKLVWDDFCAWYLEMVKPPYGTGMDRTTFNETVEIFESLLKVLHPFMPFISEEIWHLLKERKDATESICVAPWPASESYNDDILNAFDLFAEAVIGVRNVRKENNIANKEKVSLKINAAGTPNKTFDAALAHLTNIESIEYIDTKPTGCFTFILKGSEYFIPFTANVDVEAEKKKIEEELTYAKGFLKSVEVKLSNEKFVNNAPAQVLENERKKQADALSKIKLASSSPLSNSISIPDSSLTFLITALLFFASRIALVAHAR